MLTTQTGTSISKISIEEMAKMLLACPNTVFVFSTDTKDNSPDIYSWYNIANVKIFDTQTIIINREGFGGAAFAFDLLDYNGNVDYGIGEEQSDECVGTIIREIKEFNKLHGEDNNELYLDEEYRGYITIENKI